MNRLAKTPIEDIANRLPEQQRRILAYLAAYPPPAGEYIGDLPRTSDVVDALGRARDKAGYASVSRSLSRLWAAGRIESYAPFLATRGFGRRWSTRAA